MVRVRREEREFQQLNGARTVLEALQKAGALTEAASGLLDLWNQMRGYRTLEFNGVRILPPHIPE